MQTMIDPMNALHSLQVALHASAVDLSSCELFPSTGILCDELNGHTRFTYAQIEGNTLHAIAMFVSTESIDDIPCFQVGYAVVESLRGQGIATRLLKNAIEELKLGLSRTHITEFYLEAIVATTNVASRMVAERNITNTPTPITDLYSGDPAYQYLQRVQCGA